MLTFGRYFETRDYEKFRYIVRIVNSLICAAAGIPLFALYCGIPVFENIEVFIGTTVFSCLFLGFPCLGLTYVANEDCNTDTGKFIGSMIFAPTLLIIEPITKLTYFIFKSKLPKRIVYGSLMQEV